MLHIVFYVLFLAVFIAAGRTRTFLVACGFLSFITKELQKRFLNI